MSKRNPGRINDSQSSFGRRRLAKRSHVLMEAMEPRRLLSTYTLTDQGSGTANGTYLQALLNGTTTISGNTIKLGDTIILATSSAGVQSIYDMGTQELQLPNLGAAAIIPAANINGSGQLTGTITGTNITFAGGGYTSAPTVVFFGGSGSGAAATAILGSGTASGTVVSITINTNGGGSGYSNIGTNASQIALEGNAGTLTIESSGYSAGDLGSGRVNPATQVGDLARISGSNLDGIVVTNLSDTHGHSGAAQNYTFEGIEVSPDSATDFFSDGYVQIGVDSAAQNYAGLVPTNFTFNQDYIHGGAPGETSDDLNFAALQTNAKAGIKLNANYVTVENSQISDIHGDGTETHAIGGVNGLGNYTINNNYIEATGEGILFGGAEIWLPSPDQINNVAITNNYFTKNLAWNPNSPQFVKDPNDPNYGTGSDQMDVKNDLELKTGINVIISQNLFENVWVGGDQRGEAIALNSLAQVLGNDSVNVADVTVTDNVIRNCGRVIQFAAGAGTLNGLPNNSGPSEIAHDLAFNNNLAYNIGGFQWGVAGDEEAISIDAAQAPINNLTIENNTIIGTDGEGSMEGPASKNGPNTGPVAANFVCLNNVFDESTNGLVGNNAGYDNGCLNTVLTAALTITNPGSGYATNGVSVTFTGGGATGTNVATATAVIWPSGWPLSGQVQYIQIINCGSGYTSAPTVTISGGGGSGAAASAMAPVIVNGTGTIRGYDFTNNVIIGGSSSNYPLGNYCPTIENLTGFLDMPGDEYGLIPTAPGGGANPYYAAGTNTDGTGLGMGVNMSLITNITGGNSPWNPSDVSNSIQDYYKFDEDTGTTAADSAQAALAGADNSPGTLSSSTLWTTSGEMNSGIALSGSGYVKVPNFTADASFSFAAWINPNTVSANSYIASTANNAFSLYINSNEQLVAAGTTGTILGSASTALPASSWSLVSVTYSSGTLTLYVNGAEVGSTTATTTTSTNTTLYIGASSSAGSSFSGTIDEVRYYSTSLSGVSDVVGDTNLGRAGGVGYSTNTAGFSVTFSGGGGSNAAATAYAANGAGVITSIVMANSGSGYTSAPTMSFAAGSGTGALDTAAMSVSPMAYLYQQYGPQFENTWAGESGPIKGKSTTLATAAISPDESPSLVTIAWSVITYPQVGNDNKPTFDTGINSSTVNFYNAGSYLFQAVATDSITKQTTTLDFPVTVEAISSATNVISISPTNVTLATGAGATFSVADTVNGSTNITSISNLPVVGDQFNNPMPSSGWSWSVESENYSGTINGTSGAYVASNVPIDLSGVIRLKYATPDGITSLEATASVDVIDASAPSQPRSLTATPSGTNNVLTWVAPSSGGQAYYEIFTSSDNNNNDYNLYITLNSSTATTWTDTTEAAGSTWYYEVQAFNAGGGGGTAGPVGIITGAPAVPTTLAATAGINSVGLTWVNPAGTNASGVDVWRTQDSSNTSYPNTSYIEVGIDLPNTTSNWTDNASNDPSNTPTANTTYYYVVTAYDYNNSTKIDSLGSDVASATPFSAPTIVTATGIASNQVAVSWNDPSNGQASFNVQYENVNGGSWTYAGSVGAGVTFLVVPGLNADTQYNFEVEAFITSVGTSPWSTTTAYARTFNPNSSLVAYEGFNYPVTGSSTALNGENGGIGWSGGAWSATSAYTVTPTSLVDTNSTVAANLLTAGGAMKANAPGTFATRTLNSSVGGTSGNTVWASVLVEPTGSAVAGFVQLNGTSGTTTTNVEFGFIGGDFAMRIDDSTEWQMTSLTPTLGNTYFLVFELQYGSTNTWNLWVDPNPALPSSQWSTSTGYVKGTNTTSIPAISYVSMWGGVYGGEITNSDELRIGTSSSAVTPLIVPNAPTSLAATPGTSSVALSWNAPTEPTDSNLVQGYDVWRSSNSGTTWTEIATGLASSASSYTDSNVTAGTTYSYEVTAENTTGDSINSNVASAIYNPLPNAPSNLVVATPGTSSIAMTWTDPSNTSNVTGYHIWRSTDNATWGSSAYATVTGSTATSFTDTSPASGTTYFYEVTSYNSAGNSTTAAGMTCGVATVYAYEGFNYSSVSNWNGGSSGVGFSGVWSINNTTEAAITSGSLSYTSGSSALTTSGNSVTLHSGGAATQTLSASIGSAPSTLWVGFEFNDYSTSTSNPAYPELFLGNYNSSTNATAFGSVTGNKVNAMALVNGTHYYLTGSTSITANQTYFVAYEVIYSTAGDVINMYVDPTLGPTVPATVSGSLTLPASAQMAATNILSMEALGSETYATYDEIRLGATYGSVAPDPLVTGGSGNSGTSSKHDSTHKNRATPFLSSGSSHKHATSSDLITKTVKTSTSPFYPGLDASWRWNDNDADNNALFSAASNDANGPWKGLFNN